MTRTGGADFVNLLRRHNVKPSKNVMPGRGWVLYDNSCGFCSRWIPFWASTLWRRGYEVAPLQSQWVRHQLRLPNDALLHDLRLLLVDGTHVQGPEVYRQVMKRIWWAYPLYLLACAPVLRRVFDLSYRTFAKNRHRFSRACGLASLPGSPANPDAGFDISHR